MSPQALGSNSRTLIEKETTFKVTPSSPQAPDLVYFVTNTLRLARNLISSNTIRGNRNPSKPVVGNKDVSGDITLELQGYMGRFLEGALGSVDSADEELTVGSPSAAFVPGETITGGTSGATATVVYDNETDTLFILNRSGTFGSETVTGGTSGSTAIAQGNATGATSPYVHRFYISTVTGSVLPSYTIERGYSDIVQYFLYNGCKVNTLSFSVLPEGFQEVTVNYMGAKETVSSSSYAETEEVVDNGKTSFDGFTISTLEEGGVAIATVTTIDGLTIENNLDGSVYVIDPSNPGERRTLPAGTAKITGTLTAVFEDLALYNKAVASSPTETSLKIKYMVGTGDGSENNEAIEFYIPELIFSPQAPVVEGATGVLVELPFEAYYDDTVLATSAMHVLLWNTQSSI